MKLKNYLRELLEWRKVDEQEIRICGVEKLLRKIYCEIKARKGWGSAKIVYKHLNIPRRTFYGWLNGSPIPISKFFELTNLWRLILNKSTIDDVSGLAFKESQYFSVARGKKVRLPKEVNVELAYLLGYLLGDGCLVDFRKKKFRTGNFKYEIKLASDREDFAANVIKFLFKKIFGLDIRIYQTKHKMVEIFAQSKVLYVFLNKVCDVPIGKKKGKLTIPSIVKKSSEKIKAAFIAGFFDADGCIHEKEKLIYFGQADENFLKEISQLLEELSILTRPIYKKEKKLGTTYELGLRWNSLQRFIDIIPLLHPDRIRRANKLKKIISK
jgi:intein/homing endonuclease